MLERHHHDVGAGVQDALGQRGDAPAEGLEDVVVALGLPRRVDRRGEGVDERVHVGAGQVVLLVPGGRGQQHVAEQAGRGHPEVDADQQVELAAAASSRHVTSCGRNSCGRLLGADGVVGAQQVLEEELVALAGGAQQVGPPDREHPGPVLRGVGVLDGELQVAGLQLLDHVVGRGLARRLRLLRDRQGVAVQAREARHPARARGLGEGVDHRPSGEPVLAQRRGQALGAERVVAPLAGVDVPERGADHLPRRPRPVQAEGQLRPAGHRAALLLADVVRPATTVDALASGEGDQREERAVDRVGVEPVVGPGPEDDHRAAAGLLGVGGELPADPLGHRGRHAGDLLLPCRGVGRGVVVAGRPVAGQALAAHSVLRQHQVVDRGDQARTRRPSRARPRARRGDGSRRPRCPPGRRRTAAAGPRRSSSLRPRRGSAPGRRPRGRGSTCPRPPRRSGSPWSRSGRAGARSRSRRARS